MHLRENLEEVKNALPGQTKRYANFALEKGTSSWLTVIPARDVDFTPNKRESKDAIHLRYDWQMSDTLSTRAFGDVFDVGHAFVCRCEGFIGVTRLYFFGFVTRMQSFLETSPQNKSTTSMRERRIECIPTEC